MSRKLALGVLVVMLVLLGVMNVAVQRAGKPGGGEDDEQAAPPSPEARKQMEAARKASADNMRKLEAEKAARAAKAAKTAQAMQKGKPVKPKTPAGALDINENWFTTNKDGSVGVEQQKKSLEAEKKNTPAKSPIPSSPTTPTQAPPVK